MSISFLNFIATAEVSVTEEVVESAGQFTRFMDNLGIDTPFITAQIINFCIVAFILYYFAFKPVLVSLNTRNQKIAEGLQYAEEMRQKLAETERHYVEKMQQAGKEAHAVLEQAREDAKQFAEKQSQEAIHHAEEIIRKAREATEQERVKMMNEVRHETSKLVVAVTSKILGRDLSAQEAGHFNERALEELLKK